ncbi:MAG: protein kinase [Candidatus Zixiibacteriota bacterium]|nr:MAG: protein kinase [candidate division Zixibacteria bacterium]
MFAEENGSEFTKDTLISDYKIIEKLGSGGAGDVYLAYDTKLERKVALKFLPAITVSTAEGRGKLLEEARAASRIKHPNIISIHAFEEYDGRDFIVMEYVEGSSAKELAERGDSSIDKVISMVLQISEGLNAAHEAGLVHGDIKSENIIVDNSGMVKIADFGLARFREHRDCREPESISGTIPYMSPEQTQGDRVDHRSDIFSLGVVAYELISGQMPFRGEFVASIIYSIVNDTPEPLKKFRDDIPEGLQKIVSRMLAKKPEDRYQNVFEIIDEIKQIQKGPVYKDDIGADKAIGKRAMFLTATGILALALLIWIFKPFRERQIQPVHAEKTIAVLPFDNLGSEEDEFFSDGITDAIITNLAKIKGLNVISRTSSMQYKERSKALPDIGADLRAGFILEGVSFWDTSGDSDMVRISSRLIKARDDIHIWAREYNRTAENIILLQSEIARDVAFQVDSTIQGLDRINLEAGMPTNLEAYYSYLRGKDYFNRSWDEDDIRTAIDFYQDAVGKDTEYAVAYSALSIGHSTMYSEFYDRTDKRLTSAREAAARSLELIPGLPEGHYAMGMYYYSTMMYDSAMTEYDTVMKNQPGNSDVYKAIAGVQRRLGDFDNAVNNYIKAFDLDPLSYLKAFDIGLTYGLSRNFTEAVIYLDKAISLSPDRPLPYIYKAWLAIFSKGDKRRASEIIESARDRSDLERSEYQEYYWWLSRIIDDDLRITLDRIKPGSDTASCYLYKAQIYRLTGETAEKEAYSDTARIILEQKLKVRPDEARFHSQLGLAYANLGKSKEAVDEGMKGVKLAPISKEAFYAQFLVTNLAEIYVIIGDYDSAVEQLKILLSIPGFASVPYLRLDPLWKPLYDHPGFKELIKEQ